MFLRNIRVVRDWDARAFLLSVAATSFFGLAATHDHMPSFAHHNVFFFLFSYRSTTSYSRVHVSDARQQLRQALPSQHCDYAHRSCSARQQPWRQQK